MEDFEPGGRVVFVNRGLASPGTLVSQDDEGYWLVKWDDGLAANIHAFAESKLLHLVCEKGSWV
jgi:hypothetical protein